MEYITEILSESWWIILLIGGLFTVIMMIFSPIKEEYEPLDKYYNKQEEEPYERN